ncbi:hypothetical protein HYALB_00005049 [Hymenoscyphus albidus]|uniref:chitinase n=1 Tax=Hymenoscyphus albidus TaxID=595503 RepID=A0A9N9LSR2_9HELO|nr:hypothetical protein HYALB_00005049 [Hymenoscyphus albidus]
MRFSRLLLGASAILPVVLAQTWTDCNPLNTTCPNNPALGTNHTFVFNSSSAVTDTFNITAGKLNYTEQGTQYSITKQGESPTIQSNWHIMFGSVSVLMKAAYGQGIISSIVLQSSDLDEIDWEFMGGNATHAETNYFGKGNTTSFDRAVYYPVSSDVRANFHNYTIVWTAETLTWMIDGATVRVLKYAEANGGNNYPQTPMNLRIGIWAGGDVTKFPQGTVDWAGGATDFSKAPWSMFVKEAEVKDYGSGKEYQWTDKSGDWKSIKAIAGNSTAVEAITRSQTPHLTISEKWAALPQTAKVGVYVGAVGFVGVAFAAFLFIFMRQRKKGRLEREAYNASIEKEREEKYKDQMELQQKGQGGYNERDLANQGEDALGGWGTAHATSNPDEPESPTSSRNAQKQTLLGDVPLRANEWHGGNQGGMIHDAGNARTGLYTGPGPQSPEYKPDSSHSNSRGLIGNAQNAHSGGYASPSFNNNYPLAGQVPQQGQTRGGYQQF